MNFERFQWPTEKLRFASMPITLEEWKNSTREIRAVNISTSYEFYLW